MQERTHTRPKLQLPLSVIGRIDVARLLRELDALSNFLESAELREPDKKPKMPKTSRLLDETLLQNKLDALLKADRTHLQKFLEEIRTAAPVIHMSFSSDPSPMFLQKLITWLREKVSSSILLQVGLQPTIGAGCIVRTSNRQLDFSLRQKFADEKGIMIKMLRELKAPQAESPPAESLPAVSQPPAAEQPGQASLSEQPVVPLMPTKPQANEGKQ